METKLPKRKTPHLKNYDYGKSGVYFVTICTENRRQLLSHIVRTDSTAVNETNSLRLVGEGLVPPENDGFEQTISLQNEPASFANNYKVILTSIGKIAEDQILDLEKRFCNVKIKSYVIMPDHIHILVNLRMESFGKRSGIPVVYCDDFGHGTNHAILPVGVKAEFDADRKILKYK